MANVTIPNLTSATTIAPSTDLMVLEQTEGTRKATLSQIFTSSATSGSGLGITSGGVYTIKSGLDSDISDINTLLGNTSIASIGDGTVTGAISTLNSDLKPKLLWENSNKTTPYTGGTISLLQNDCDYFLILFNQGGTSLQVSASGIVMPNTSSTFGLSGTIGGLESITSGEICAQVREITEVTQTSITFGHGYLRTATGVYSGQPRDQHMIPCYVIGYKFY